MSRLFFIFAILLITMLSNAAEMGMNIHLKLKSPAGVYPTESGVNIKLQVLTQSGACVLREETFSSQAISEGSVSLVLGQGAVSGLNPNLSLNQVFDNSAAKSGLSCIDNNGSIVSSQQTYTPSASDSRLIRFTATIQSDLVIADFPLNAVAYAIQAESVAGKKAADLLVQNPATQLNQSNLESLLANSTKLANLQNIANGGPVSNATSAVSFSGVLAGDISGTQSAVSVNKIKGVAVSSTAPSSGQVLQFDGSQYVPVAIPSAPVTSVAGRTGNVVLSSSDISGLDSLMDSAAPAGGDLSGTLAHLTVQTVGGSTASAISNSVAEVNAATSANAISKIVKRDASGNIAVNSLSSNNISSQNIYLYDSTNTNSVQIKSAHSFSNYVLTLPTSAGGAGQILTTDGSGQLIWSAPGGAGTVTSVTAGMGLSGGSITSSGTIDLANTTVTAGSYGASNQVSQITVDAQGRLTAASSLNIALPPSQITQAAASAGQVLKWNGSAWAPANDADTNSGGTVTSVNSSNSYLTVTNASSAPSLTINVGSSANTLAAGDDARILGALASTTFDNYVASANCSSTQTIYWNSVSSNFLCQTIGTVANATNAENFTGAVSGDVTGNQTSLSVNRLRGTPISATAPTSGQVMAFDGTNWAPAKGLPKFIKSTADQTFAATALANATSLSFSVVAGVTYKYKFNILYTSAATTTGLRIGVTFPAASMQSALANIPGATADGTGFLYSGFISSSGDSVMSANSPALSPTVMMANIEGIFIPSASGAIQLRAATEVANSNIVIKAGSFVEVVELP